ncbi:hypothetical protein K438DRAFT_1785372 [Mycena galopus ATCC 62051]|nr:hypothetical protein K438DRAFT_1785372 [Mycena galopus ATCC 62051]
MSAVGNGAMHPKLDCTNAQDMYGRIHDWNKTAMTETITVVSQMAAIRVVRNARPGKTAVGHLAPGHAFHRGELQGDSHLAFLPIVSRNLLVQSAAQLPVAKSCLPVTPPRRPQPNPSAPRTSSPLVAQPTIPTFTGWNDGIDEGEDAPDIIANTFLAEVTQDQLDRVGTGFLAHRHLCLAVFGHLAWTAQHATGNCGDSHIQSRTRIFHRAFVSRMVGDSASESLDLVCMLLCHIFVVLFAVIPIWMPVINAIDNEGTCPGTAKSGHNSKATMHNPKPLIRGGNTLLAQHLAWWRWGTGGGGGVEGGGGRRWEEGAAWEVQDSGLESGGASL